MPVLAQGCHCHIRRASHPSRGDVRIAHISLLLNNHLFLWPNTKLSFKRIPVSLVVFSGMLVFTGPFPSLPCWVNSSLHSQPQTDPRAPGQALDPQSSFIPDFQQPPGPKVCPTMFALPHRLFLPLQALDAHPEKSQLGKVRTDLSFVAGSVLQECVHGTCPTEGVTHRHHHRAQPSACEGPQLKSGNSHSF